MSGLFRSEDMSSVRLLMTDEAAYDTVKELGFFGKLHVVDLSTAHDSHNSSGSAAQGSQGSNAPGNSDSFVFYKKRVAACVFWERKLLSFKELFPQFNVQPPSAHTQAQEIVVADVLESLKEFLDPLEDQITKNVVFKKQQSQQIAELNERLVVLTLVQQHQLTTLADNQTLANKNNNENSNAYGTFRTDSYDERDLPMTAQGDSRPRTSSAQSLTNYQDGNFHTVLTGIISKDKVALFERMLFRVSRGNCVVRVVDFPNELEDPATGDRVFKSVFSILLLGDQLQRRIEKLFPFFGATQYSLPSNASNYLRETHDLRDKINEMKNVIDLTDKDISSLLNNLAFSNSTGTSPWVDWYQAVIREKAICDTLKKCDSEGPSSKMVRLEGWVPTGDLDDLRLSLHNAVRKNQQKQAVLQVLPIKSSPPTYFKTNAFTGSFQAIVDTYGIPRYKEVNPGLFTIITFPFLFGVMYGDIGHATFLTIFGLYLILNEKTFDKQLKAKELGEMFSMAYGGRYLLFLMGAFGIYAGTIYNDCMSVPFATFGTHWVYGPNATDGAYANATGDGHVNWGFDHEWYYTKNQLAFFNSFKMKLAVTLGVAQMTFGIFLSLLNHLYFGDTLHVFFEFIPRLVFLFSTFGYMIFIIIIKFCTDWTGKTGIAPNLVQTMIEMFLSPGSVGADKQLYEGQATIQLILLFAALLSVPFMLLPIPIITNRKHKKLFPEKFGENPSAPSQPSNSLESPLLDRANDFEINIDEKEMSVTESSSKLHSNSNVDSSAAEEAHGHSSGGGHGPDYRDYNYSFSDHMITQGIHTIEFVLGTVSNTASYLRLWALSLAHAELASVFWDKMIMEYGVNTNEFYMMVAGVAVWSGATFAVLMCMDVLECFLHALRLHWVEFQNKFFNADGYAFTPFDFKTLED